MVKFNSTDWIKEISSKYNLNLLQTEAWGKLKSSYGWQPVFFKTEHSAAMVLFRKLFLGFTIAYIPKGPLGKPSDWDSLWPHIEVECKKRKSIVLKIEPDEEGEQPSEELLKMFEFQISAQTVQPPNTIILDIEKTEDEILARMKQKTRYNIRLATKKGIQVENTNDFQVFADLMKVTGERDGFGVHTPAYYQQAYELFHPLGDCELFVAKFEEAPLAAVMVFKQGKRAWYLFGASNNLHRNIMPAYLLQWEAIRWAKNQGCTSYDMVGIPDFPEDELERDFNNRHDGLWGVYRFKRGFGGNIVRSVGAWDKVLSPLLYSVYNFVLRLRNG
jgi:peptidoglycan pentaglycine glycine transferase (the first glycine)